MAECRNPSVMPLFGWPWCVRWGSGLGQHLRAGMANLFLKMPPSLAESPSKSPNLLSQIAYFGQQWVLRVFQTYHPYLAFLASLGGEGVVRLWPPRRRCYERTRGV